MPYLCPSATDILLAGSSAGGIGAFEHADYVAKLFPQALVKANPIGKADCWVYTRGNTKHPVQDVTVKKY